jgi:hypothetical protein
MSKILRRALPLASVTLLAAAGPAAAQDDASTARVGDGQTMLRLDPGTAKALTGAGVRVSVVQPGKVGSSGLTFPATGGAIDPATLRGSVEHRGGIRFRAGGKTVTLSSPRYTIGSSRSTLSASVGGKRLSVLSLNLKRAKVGARGPLTKTAQGIRATLTAGAAKALNQAFSTSLFRGGLAIGTVRTEIVLADAVFDGGATSLALDPGAASALQSLGVTPGVLAPATAGSAGLAFPITAGKVDAKTLAGSIAHSGGISLTKGATAVELRDFEIGLDDSPSLSAIVGGQRVEILTLDVSGVKTSTSGGTIVVSGVVAKLTAAAAGALNQAFGTTAFSEGLTLGTATVRGRTA